jgi:hypothetical protein
MRRRLIQFGLLLLLLAGGAIVNAGVVAYVAIMLREHPTSPGSIIQSASVGTTRWKVRTWRTSTLVGVKSKRERMSNGLAIDSGAIALPAWAESLRRPSNAYARGDQSTEERLIIARGWPCPAMSLEVIGRPRPDRFGVVGGFDLGDPAPSSTVTLPRLIPCRPIWPGFAINTMFYAAMLGALLLLFAAPFALRRRVRIRRGLCPACAYPVGASDVCTECGQPVNGSSRRVPP